MTQDEDDIRKQNQLRQQVEYQRAEKDFAAVVDTPEGRRFIKRLLGECSVYQSTFTGEALTTAHREGKRAIGLWVLEHFTQHPDAYIQFLTEKTHE
jgi:hypothetical protein